jgi:coxsackievirus/adenovirus receptor
MNSNHKSCEDSWYGCCPDGKTAALGADHAGCPSMCGCNKLGKFIVAVSAETFLLLLCVQ